MLHRERNSSSSSTIYKKWQVDIFIITPTGTIFKPLLVTKIQQWSITLPKRFLLLSSG